VCVEQVEETGRRIDGLFHDILGRVSALEVPATAPQTSRAGLDSLRETPARLVRLLRSLFVFAWPGGVADRRACSVQAAVDAELQALQERVADALTQVSADTSASASLRGCARWGEIRAAVRRSLQPQDGSAAAALEDIAALIRAKAEEVFGTQTLLAW